MKKIMSKEMRSLALSLFIITAITALLLAFTYESTKGIIADKKTRLTEESLREALPQATDFAPMNVPESDLIKQAFTVMKGREKIGYAVIAYGDGYSSTKMVLLVTTDMEKVITSVTVLENLETKGIGTVAAGQWYLDEFKGIKGSIGEEVKAITSATISSQAIIECVQNVLDFLSEV